MRLQQYGLQRTGTNALQALVEHNLDVGVIADGKHDIAAPGGADGYLVSVKDPASWVWSVYQWRRMKYSNEDPPREHHFTEDLVEEHLQHWERHTLSHLTLARTHADRSVVVQHERLLREPRAVLAAVRDAFALEWSGRPLELFLGGYAWRGDGSLRGADLIDPTRRVCRDYHLNAEWAREVPAPLLARCLRFTRETFAAHPLLRDHIDLGHLPEMEDQ